MADMVLSEAIDDYEAHKRTCYGCANAQPCERGIELFQRAVRVSHRLRRETRDAGPCGLCGAYDGDHDEGCPCS